MKEKFEEKCVIFWPLWKEAYLELQVLKNPKLFNF